MGAKKNLDTNVEDKKAQKVMKKINDRHGLTIKFPVYLNSRLMDAELNELELTQRSFNCLRRAGYATVGEIVNSITRPEDLNHIRNLGKKSQNEIMFKIFILQYNSLTLEKQKTFIKRVEELNFGPEPSANQDISLCIRELMEKVV